MLNISSIKELLHKPSGVQWNIIGTLPEKLKRKITWAEKIKRKITWALSYKILPPEITKMWGIAISEGIWGAWEPMWNSMGFYDFLNFWKFQSLSFD